MGKDAGKRYFITENGATTGVGVKASGFTIAGRNLKAVVGVAAACDADLNRMAAGTFGEAACTDGERADDSD